jgi:hypothetical protein
MAVIFFVFAKDDPELVARREKGTKPPSFAEQFAPLRNLQVWRFSLYYFFVFGAFVALALWMPHYLIDVYGVDVKTAGMAAASFSLSASLFRAYGGHLSDKFGARQVMYWTFSFTLLFLFMLSYPPTDYVIQGKDGPIAFSTSSSTTTASSVICFTCPAWTPIQVPFSTIYPLPEASSTNALFPAGVRKMAVNFSWPRSIFSRGVWGTLRLRFGLSPGGFVSGFSSLKRGSKGSTAISGGRRAI